MSDPSAHPEIDEAAANELIRSVNLANISEEKAASLTATLAAADRVAFVNRGSIQYLSLPEQQKTDSLYWTLFAQLAADARINRENDPVGWYKEYIRVLGLVGMRSGEYKRDQASGSEAGTSVDTTLLKYLKPFLSPAAQNELEKIINSLKRESNRGPLTIFNQSAGNTSSANFQVSDGTVDRFLNLTIHVGTLDFRTNQNITNLLFWRWTNRNFTFFYGRDTLTLSKSAADRLRKNLYDRVINHIKGNIDDIELAT
jgi:hypothetical protein